MPQEKKVEAIREYHQLPTKEQVCAFLGMAEYCLRFVLNFSYVAFPLSDLIRKGQPDQVQWIKVTEKVF